MTVFFVTSTGTNIGKTYVGCGLLSHWRAKGRTVEAYKPLLSGFNPAQLAESDAGRLLTALGRPVNAETLDQVWPQQKKLPRQYWWDLEPPVRKGAPLPPALKKTTITNNP